LKKKEHFQSALLQASFTLISKPDKDATRKENHSAIFPVNPDAKILNKILES
jgi:hypothetical protein